MNNAEKIKGLKEEFSDLQIADNSPMMKELENMPGLYSTVRACLIIGCQALRRKPKIMRCGGIMNHIKD